VFSFLRKQDVNIYIGKLGAVINGQNIKILTAVQYVLLTNLRIFPGFKAMRLKQLTLRYFTGAGLALVFTVASKILFYYYLNIYTAL